jgi:hypothetical protein
MSVHITIQTAIAIVDTLHLVVKIEIGVMSVAMASMVLAVLLVVAVAAEWSVIVVVVAVMREGITTPAHATTAVIVVGKRSVASRSRIYKTGSDVTWRQSRHERALLLSLLPPLAAAAALCILMLIKLNQW